VAHDGQTANTEGTFHLDRLSSTCDILQARAELSLFNAMQTSTHSKDTPAPRVSPRSNDGFLLSLGKRVRELRNRRGLTRKMMAREADVSERHLAQLETGEGNVSIVLLRRIAAALHVSLADLFAAEMETRHEKVLIQRFLERLPAHRVEDAMSRLLREFGDEDTARRKRVALIGLRGAGKSTLGARLGADLNIPFVELDGEIEKDTGMPLGEIFSLYGQTGYRAIERRSLERVLHEQERAIVSVGGGVVSEKETYEYLLSNCYTVWIKARPEEHMARVIAQGDLRVIAGGNQAMDDLRRILEAREPLYRKADMYLDTSGNSVEESFAKLKAALHASEKQNER
jgi:XRE family transcriptional regulator, aerobic/anaerobic benzoate catabolism transcriptional regulator